MKIFIRGFFWLNEIGLNTESVRNLKFVGYPDEDILKFAEENERVVITHDSDFGR